MTCEAVLAKITDLLRSGVAPPNPGPLGFGVWAFRNLTLDDDEAALISEGDA